jgi:phenylalanyl-tRNA synthetase beta chain
MKISLRWLEDFIELNQSAEEIGKILTATGLEVEGIESFESVPGSFKGVVIGEVMSCEPHPNADRLRKTTVDVGKAELLKIVCGAPNVAAGQKVAVALVGTTLYPNGEELTLKKTKIRGEESEGMICAEDELSLGTNHNGILVLDTDLPNGTPFSELYPTGEDQVFEIGLTPNRVDAASHLGVARDLKAVLQKETCFPQLADLSAFKGDSKVQVLVDNTEACIRYSGVVLDGIQLGPSPKWMQDRLKSIGIGPISNVVDITNYVMHELGQPLHAFDLDKISSGIVRVKTLSEGTPFVTLDEKERKLKSEDLMICNDQEPMCIAGVFGGIHSGVSEQTTSIFLESATFHPAWVRKSSQNHALKTDASFRFERGADPDMTIPALRRAAKLLMDIAGAQIASPITDVYPNPVQAARVEVLFKNVTRLIGIEIPKAEIFRILEALDFEIENKTEEAFVAVVPAYRVDVNREADIIEEILRIYGLDNIALSASNSSDFLAEHPKVDTDKVQWQISEMLIGSGFLEIMTNSLTRPAFSKSLSDFNPEKDIEILNKLSEDLGIMRQSMLFTGLDVLAYNQNHKQRNLKLYEFGKVYSKADEKYIENEQLAMYLCGTVREESWIEPAREASFHDLYQVVSMIAARLNFIALSGMPVKNSLLAYGLELYSDEIYLGYIGLLSQQAAKIAQLREAVFVANLEWGTMLSAFKQSKKLQEVSKFPEVRRDLSLVIDKKILFSDIQEITQRKEFGLIRRINAFDVYEGSKIEAGKKAYAISFILQDNQKTLTDKDIDRTMNRLMQLFEKELGAMIRK